MATKERYNPEYARNVYHRVRRNETVLKYFEKFIVTGKENLHKNPDRQRIYIANHLSHMDYALAWLQFHRQGVRMPMIPAGSNLNQPLLKMLGLDFGKLCGYFIDRDVLKAEGKEATRHQRETIQATREIIKSGLDLLVFPDGGRSYSGELFKKYDGGIIKTALGIQRDIDIVPIALAYDHRVEESVMPILRNVSRKTLSEKIKYYGADIAAYFVTRPIAKGLGLDVGNAYMNIGEPISLSEIERNSSTEKRNRIEIVKEFSEEEIKRLYDEISKRQRKRFRKDSCRAKRR